MNSGASNDHIKLESQASSSFDPNSFVLPDLSGPETPAALKKPPQVQRIENQAKRESLRTNKREKEKVSSGYSIVKKTQLTFEQTLSKTRAQNIEALCKKLQNIQKSLKTPLLKDQKDKAKKSLMHLIAQFKGVFQENPKDLKSMTLLDPLLKCQYVKWQALKESEVIIIPPPESAFLIKLQSPTGVLGTFERMCLTKWIQALNSTLMDLQNVQIESIQKKNNENEVQTHTDLDLSDFSPLQATREILQLRSKAQRTQGDEAKKKIKIKIEVLLKNQMAYHAQRRQTQLKSACSKIEAHLKQTESSSQASHDFIQTKKLLLTLAQKMNTLFEKDEQKETTQKIFQATLSQVSRIGLPDASKVIRGTQIKQKEWVLQLNKTSQQGFQDWLEGSQALIKLMIVRQDDLKHSIQIQALEKKLTQLDGLIEKWPQEMERLQVLEKECASGSSESFLKNKKSLLEGYAEWLSELPHPEI